jgi:bacteriocin-like protein
MRGTNKMTNDGKPTKKTKPNINVENKKKTELTEELTEEELKKVSGGTITARKAGGSQD